MTQQGTAQSREVNAAELQAQIREQVRQSLADAQAQLKAARADMARAQARTTSQTQTVVRTEPLAPLPAMAPAPPSGVPQVYTTIPGSGDRVADIPPRAQEMVMVFFVVIAFVIVGFPIARAIARLIDRKSAAGTLKQSDIQPQLLRIEQSIEAMAIEIERVSEGQRYLTRLQSEREELLIPRRSVE